METGATVHLGVGRWIERRARMDPDRVALITAGGLLTYASLAARIRRLANGLRQLGVVRGDRVAWLGPNDPAFLESLFAVGLLGAVLAPVNHRLDEDGRAIVLDDAEPRILVRHRAIDPTRLPVSVEHVVSVGDGTDEGLDYEALLAAASEVDIDEPIGLDELLLLPHTSGTSGRPKGVMLTHGNVTWNVVNLLSCADFRGDDVTVAIAPFFRVGGTGVNVLPVLFLGGAVVVPEVVSGDAVLQLMERHRVTVGFGNPDLLEALVRSERWPAADLSSIRFVVTGGAPVPERLIRVFLARGITLVQGYGLSEASPFVLLVDHQSALRKVGSAGKPPLLTDIRIVAPDGPEVTPGEAGELQVRGPNVMAGYWRLPEETAEVLGADGWLRTGDAARVDDEGYVWIVDRVEAAFRSGGTVVYPGDVERVLAMHPSVADVGVVGVAGPGGREVAAAAVVLEPDAAVTVAELLAFAAARLPPHERPVSIALVGELPRNSVGKLLREELRTRLASGAG